MGTIFAASGARLRAPAGGFIKRRRAGLTRSTCAGPARPRPRPRPLRSLQPCGPALRRPPWAWRGGGGEAGERDTTQEGASSEGRAAGGHFYLRGAQRSGALSAPLPPGLSFPFQVPKPRRRSCGGDARPPEHRATPLPFQ